MSEAFEGWTIKQLQVRNGEKKKGGDVVGRPSSPGQHTHLPPPLPPLSQTYIRETGGNPDEADSKRELILMCVSAARAAEAAVAPPVPAAVPPPGGGRKRALLIGCNYAGTSAALSGCENDARCLEYLLRTRFAFDDVTLLLDSAPHPAAWPTRQNILWHAHALAAGGVAGDSLFFAFSGHGAQVRDPAGDEDDGMNETILPCDHGSVGMIVDDELNAALINPLQANVKLHALIDACHSGSALDLEWQVRAWRRVCAEGERKGGKRKSKN
jgi:hypothetical protein